MILKYLFVTRLRLHMCSEHEHRQHRIQCPVCCKNMLGAVYEAHVVKDHASLLEAESYFFTPKVLAVKAVSGVETLKNKINKMIMNQQAPQPSQPYSIDFKVENPWQEILSSTSRRKRSVDAITVGSLRKKMKADSPQNIVHINSFISETLWDQGAKSKLQPMRNKIEFISTLDSNTHYKQYLRSLRHLKMKKMMLFKFAARMTDLQIGKLRAEIKSNEQLLAQFSIINQTPRIYEKTLREDGKKRKEEKTLHIYPFNINNNKCASPGKPSPAKEKPLSMPVIDLGLGDSPTIKCENPGRESVIALNIPVEEIVENNLVIDMKSEY